MATKTTEETTVETTAEEVEETTTEETETTETTETETEEEDYVADVKAAGEAAVANLKLVKTYLREMTDDQIEEAENDLTDTMEEVVLQSGKIDALYLGTKEKVIKACKYFACFAIFVLALVGLYTVVKAAL